MQLTECELPERTVSGRVVFVGYRIGLKIDRCGHIRSRKLHLYGYGLCVDALDTEIEHQCHRCYVFYWCSPSASTGKIGRQKRTRSIIFFASGEGAGYGRTLCGNHDAVESLGYRRPGSAGAAGGAGLSGIAPDGPSLYEK